MWTSIEEEYGYRLMRMPVEGGWLYKAVIVVEDRFGNETIQSVSITFVPAARED